MAVILLRRLSSISFCVFTARRVPQPLSKSTNEKQAILCCAFVCALSETCAQRQLQSISVSWSSSISASLRLMFLWKRVPQTPHNRTTLHTFTYNLAHQQIYPHHPHLRGICYESRFFFLFFGDSILCGWSGCSLSFSYFLYLRMYAFQRFTVSVKYTPKGDCFVVEDNLDSIQLSSFWGQHPSPLSARIDRGTGRTLCVRVWK